MYDLIVLGGGPGGYLAAERAGHAGLKTLLIEKRSIGGVCLNEGCIPSKTLLNSAKLYDHACHGEKYGVTTEGAAIDLPAVIKRKNKVVTKLVKGVEHTLKSCQVDIVKGEGRILGRLDGEVSVQVGDETYAARQLIIATGSQPIVPPIPGVKEGLETGDILTSREILDLETIPKKLVVIGGGVIGLEMAGFFQTIGADVTVVEMLDHIAGAADLEMAGLLQKAYEKQGITFYLNSRVTAVKNGKVEVLTGDQTLELEADKILLSTGRRAVTEGFGLESLNVFVDRGRIVTDSQGRTNIPGVYAVGDVNGIWMLAHAAYREAEVCISTILGKKDRMRYEAMPSVVYTNPEMAFVGETEQTCKQKGIAYRKLMLPMSYSGRYLAENEDASGQIKLLVDPDGTRLLGCHLLGSYASEIILSAGMMIEREMSIEEIKELIFPHPTVSEIIREAVFKI